MKLSQMSTDRVTDVLCEIAPYAMNIMGDEELVAELRSALDYRDTNTAAERTALAISKISKLVPIVLKKRKAELFAIIGALNGKSAAEIGKQNIIKTMSQIKDISKDKELLDFFKSCTDSGESE